LCLLDLLVATVMNVGVNMFVATELLWLLVMMTFCVLVAIVVLCTVMVVVLVALCFFLAALVLLTLLHVLWLVHWIVWLWSNVLLWPGKLNERLCQLQVLGISLYIRQVGFVEISIVGLVWEVNLPFSKSRQCF